MNCNGESTKKKESYRVLWTEIEMYTIFKTHHSSQSEFMRLKLHLQSLWKCFTRETHRG